ncbi:MAG: lasso peptide biosynthesis B2 protein [Negativicutes bacterium]
MFTMAYCLSGLIRMALLYLPFCWLAVMLGEEKGESARNEGMITVSTALRIGGMVSTACRYTPWESKCLVQAIAAKLLLRLYGISNTLYLGVRCTEGNGLKAHAWLRCGGQVVTGARGREGFTVVGVFADAGREEKNIN